MNSFGDHLGSISNLGEDFAWSLSKISIMFCIFTFLRCICGTFTEHMYFFQQWKLREEICFRLLEYTVSLLTTAFCQDWLLDTEKQQLGSWQDWHDCCMHCCGDTWSRGQIKYWTTSWDCLVNFWVQCCLFVLISYRERSVLGQDFRIRVEKNV